ncbi:MAG: ribose-5-phosphate isomerase RpiA [Paracoccaceae bacterium]
MSSDLSPSDQAKCAAAARALDFVEPKMRIGLGTGSTAAWFLRLLAERIESEGLQITGVPTSGMTASMARELGIAITTLDDAGWLDLTVDGADEFDPHLNLIKGGGGALLQEKIVATASDRMIVISDESKAVETLGAFPLPVEIVRFGWETTRSFVEEVLEGSNVLGRTTTLRENRGQAFITDEGHFILDLHLRQIGDPRELGAQLVEIPGVVETGLFTDIADLVVVGSSSGEVQLLDVEEEPLSGFLTEAAGPNLLSSDT